MSILLKRGMLLADKLYKPGDILPDIEEARKLAERGDAEIINEPTAPAPKAAVKPAKPKPDVQKTDSADGTGNP